METRSDLCNSSTVQVLQQRDKKGRQRAEAAVIMGAVSCDSSLTHDTAALLISKVNHQPQLRPPLHAACKNQLGFNAMKWWTGKLHHPQSTEQLITVWVECLNQLQLCTHTQWGTFLKLHLTLGCLLLTSSWTRISLLLADRTNHDWSRQSNPALDLPNRLTPSDCGWASRSEVGSKGLSETYDYIGFTKGVCRPSNSRSSLSTPKQLTGWTNNRHFSVDCRCPQSVVLLLLTKWPQWVSS